jgi:hypothetical protein
MEARWYKGIPPVEAVAAQETLRKRRDGITLSYLSISDERDYPCYAPGNEMLFGNWIVNHIKSNIEPYVSISRLKVIEGSVYMQIGFTQWLKMDTVRWKNDIECYPVGDNGLPVGFK